MTIKLHKALSKLPPGFYVSKLSRFANGTVRTTRKGTVSVPIEIDITQLGSPFTDMRAVLNPEDNKLVPLILFVDPDEVLDSQRKEGGEG